MQASSSLDVPSESVSVVCLVHCSPCAAVATVSSVQCTRSKILFSVDFAILHTIIVPSMLLTVLVQSWYVSLCRTKGVCLQQESAHCR